MNLVSYKASEIPPITPEREAKLRVLAERPDNEIDLSDITELDEFDYKYGVPFGELMAMS